MLNKIKTFLSGTPAITEPPANTLFRRRWGISLRLKLKSWPLPHYADALQKIRENNALSSEVYQRLYLAPVHLLLERSQNVPAAPDGRWAYAGDLVI